MNVNKKYFTITRRVSVVGIWCLIGYGGVAIVDWNLFIENIHKIKKPDHIMGFIGFSMAMTLSIGLRGLRFYWLLDESNNANARQVVSAYCWLFFLGLLTPFRSGELWRIAWLRRWNPRDEGIVRRSIANIAIERGADIVVLSLFLVAASIIVSGEVIEAPSKGGVTGESDGTSEIWLTVAVAMVFLVSVCIYRNVAWKCVKRGIYYAMRLIEEMKVSVGNAGAVRIFIVTVLAWAVAAAGFGVAMTSYYGGLPLMLGVVAVAAVNIIALLASAPGNIGGYHAAIAGTLALYGIGVEEGLAYATVLHGVNIVVVTLVGVAGRGVSGWQGVA